MQPKAPVKILAFVVVLGMLGLGIAAASLLPDGLLPTLHNDHHESEIKIERFSSEEEFRSYLQEASSKGTNAVNVPGSARNFETMDLSSASNVGLGEEARVSQTNVQVRGIDEPDIVKTNGSHIFYSNPNIYRYFAEPMPIDFIEPSFSEDLILPREPQQQTKIISSYPPENLEIKSAIAEGGELLLHNNTLVVIAYNKLQGFNISEPATPKKVWEYTLESDTYLDTSRLMNGDLILITRNYLNVDTPCPMPLMSNNVRIACTDIYHPSIPVPSDSLYTAIKLNAEFGDVKSKVSFVGSSGSSVVYVSPQSIYVTYSFVDDPIELYSEFFISEGDLLPTEYQTRIQQLSSYQISEQAKLVEYEQILTEYRASLSQDDRLKFEQEMNDRLKSFAQDRVREVEKTGIVEIGIANFDVQNNGEVPGSPLNQFSLDEYAGNLRIATTVGQNNFLFPAESVNDLYVLDDSMQIVGSVQNLAKGERIYSARFIGDSAYIVTFKQIDPFFVFDLSDPNNPKAVGELKIPGFSSYLHPLTDKSILGVGQEEGQVKLSLFDVTNPSTPTEIDKYTLDEFWTEVQNNHHAFLQDDVHKVFFIPGGRGGYFFSYEGNNIELVKAIAETDAQRAIFINDYMYIIGSEEITVLNEADWSTVNTLAL